MTAEFVIVVPIVLVVLALVIGGITVAAHRIALTSAASEVVRLEARGDETEARKRLAQLDDDIEVQRATEGSLLCLTLRARPGSGALSTIAVSARACAATSDVGSAS